MPDGKSVSPKKYRCSEPKTQELLERVFTVPADDHESRRYDEKLSLPHRSTQAEEYTGSLKALLDHYLKKLHEANDAMRHRADAGTPASESDGADAKPEPANAADKKKHKIGKGTGDGYFQHAPASAEQRRIHGDASPGNPEKRHHQQRHEAHLFHRIQGEMILQGIVSLPDSHPGMEIFVQAYRKSHNQAHGKEINRIGP